jgi:DNA-binding MarR family transcriptional regulator
LLSSDFGPKLGAMAIGAGSGDDGGFVPRDSVDRLIESWRAMRPELDVEPLGVITRISRLRSHLGAEVEKLFAEYGLSGPSFAVLVTLARLEEAAGLSQRRLADELGLTSGTVSVRIDRLVEEGLVARAPDPQDKRNTRITLTEGGRELFERVAPAHLANERRLLAGLTDPEIESLGSLLRRLLVEFEGSLPSYGVPARLGLVLAPAHVSIAMRRAVGLPEEAGLLVRGVDDGGPSDKAGLRPGDVILVAGRRRVRSIGDLCAAIADARASGRLQIQAVRGVKEATATIALDELQAESGGLAAATMAGRSVRDEHRL